MKPEVAAWISILAKRLRIPLFRECDPLIREACEQGLDCESFLLLLKQRAQQSDEKAQRRRLWAARFSLAKSLDLKPGFRGFSWSENRTSSSQDSEQGRPSWP